MSETNEKLQKYKPRKPLRLAGYYYGTSGAYSVTICTKGRQPYFKHPILEQILKEKWVTLPQHFAGVTPDVLVVMPDHIHGVLWINEDIEGSPTLDDHIGGYKSITNVAWLHYMKKTSIKGSGKLWQRSFNDHIIRNEQDLREKQNYALNNPIVAEMKEEQMREEQRRKEQMKKEQKDE